jgi:RNA polymerase sigma-70 factor (ECF subfamily)
VTHLDSGALFVAHAAFVARFLTRLGLEPYEVDDAVQEVFLVAHRRGGFDEGVAQPTTWLAEIGVRVAAGIRRSRVRRPRGVAQTGSETSAPSPFEAVAAAESLGRVQRALDALSLEHRAAFILYEIEGASCDSIAVAWRVPVGTVYSRLHTARSAFQEAYARLDDVERPVGAPRGEAI